MSPSGAVGQGNEDEEDDVEVRKESGSTAPNVGLGIKDAEAKEIGAVDSHVEDRVNFDLDADVDTGKPLNAVVEEEEPVDGNNILQMERKKTGLFGRKGTNAAVSVFLKKKTCENSRILPSSLVFFLLCVEAPADRTAVALDQ